MFCFVLLSGFEAANAAFPHHKRKTICVTPESTVPIDSHVLSNLVREAFQLSKRRHLYYENLIINHRKPKDLERVSPIKLSKIIKKTSPYVN